MECSVCYREYQLSPSVEVVLPKVGSCGHSICSDCCAQLVGSKNCPYCNRARSFQRQSRCFLAEDCLTLMENTDLVKSLLPELKGLVHDLKNRKRELKKEVERPKGVVARLKRTGKGRRVIRKKERKDVLDLQKRVETLIDLTTAVIRPKLLVSTVPAPYGFLQLEARSIEKLALQDYIYGPSIEICGCSWRLYVYKQEHEKKFYFNAGVQLTTVDKSSTKKYRGMGWVTVISQKHNGKNRKFGFNCQFDAPYMKMEMKIELCPLWEDFVDETAGYVLNDRLFVHCEKWEVKEVL